MPGDDIEKHWGNMPKQEDPGSEKGYDLTGNPDGTVSPKEPDADRQEKWDSK